MTAIPAAAGRCPGCGGEIGPADRFCETCGTVLSPTAEFVDTTAEEVPISVTAATSPQRRPDPVDVPGAATSPSSPTPSAPGSACAPAATPAAATSAPTRLPPAPPPAPPTVTDPAWQPDELDEATVEIRGRADRQIWSPAPTSPATAPSRTCTECGGEVDAEGWCTSCGAKAPSERDHYRSSPSSWVGGVCDRGVRHHRNEDAMALQSEIELGSRAVLVVCDGVSSAPNSDIASTAAVVAARQVLVDHRPAGLGTPDSTARALEQVMVDASLAANAAVTSQGVDADGNPPSCTFAAAVVDGPLIVHGVVGDSRIYWFPDEDGPVQLGEDDSMAAFRMAAGVERSTAENSPGAHAITRWLGSDTPDARARTGVLAVTAPGWLLVCSDGLWNYASEPTDLQAQLRAALEATGGSPTDTALALVRWANAQGGRDNVTAALARCIPASAQSTVQSQPATGSASTPTGATTAGIANAEESGDGNLQR